MVLPVPDEADLLKSPVGKALDLVQDQGHRLAATLDTPSCCCRLFTRARLSSVEDAGTSRPPTTALTRLSGSGHERPVDLAELERSGPRCGTPRGLPSRQHSYGRTHGCHLGRRGGSPARLFDKTSSDLSRHHPHVKARSDGPKPIGCPPAC